MKIDVHVTCDIQDSFRVQRVAGIFDLPLEKSAAESFTAEIPDLDEDWKIGLIVGPSGSGKSSIARKAFPHFENALRDWPKNKALIDHFPGKDIDQIVGLLTAAGFSSPPAWLKPYRVLSTGEQFRCDLALAFARNEPVTVFDEFTSVVDRTVAKSASAAIHKAIHKGTIPGRFVAITCHYDIAEWLCPDWIMDMATGQLARSRLQRPEIHLTLHRTPNETWRQFARYHYLSSRINPGSSSYVVLWGKKKVAYLNTMQQAGRKSYRRIARVVVLPDFQGLGIGSAITDAIAKYEHHTRAEKISIVTSHPAMIQHLKKNHAWRLTKNKKPIHGFKNSYHTAGTGRSTQSFQYYP